MKNNKGIILSTYIYILLVFFILILSTMLMVLNNTKVISTKLKNSANPGTSKEDSFSIVLIGGDVYVAKGSTYVDKGYIAQTTGGSTLTAVVTSTVNMAAAGTYTYKYEVTYSGYVKSVTRTVYVIDSVYYYGYTGAVQTFNVPTTGYYKVELWGARGGNTGTGFGAYTSGYIYMIKNTNYYLYVGGVGSTTIGTNIAGGYNGGGNSGTVGASRSGGGSTDIRMIGGAWNDASGLRSRIMVAAGGGSGENNLGGSGGALMGGPNHAGTFSTQISGSAFGYATTPSIDASGAGGGYYGGIIPTADGVAAGGGSSFISGYAGVNALSGLNSVVPGNNTNHYSGNYFINGQMLAGINNGNGRAKITYVDTNIPTRVGLNNVRYVKDCVNGNSLDANDYWVELQAIYNGDNVALNKTVTGTVAQNASYPYSRIVDGDLTSANYAAAGTTGLQCVTVDLGQAYNLDEVAVWHYWADGRSANSNITYTSLDNTNWTKVIDTGNAAETSQGKRVNAYTNYFYYTGVEQTFTATKAGYYNVTLLGARGGSTTGINGYGGYTNGIVYLNKDETIKVYVGSKGIANGGTGSSILINGGYNGGANASNQAACSVRYWGSGGGATDIRLTSTLNSRIMVAGGGGGCYGGDTGCTLSGATICTKGGAGGSIIGQAGQTANGYVPGAGATQTNGGLAATQNGVTSIPGTFGIGGGPTSAGVAKTGGGGGYYGGAGSGHIDASGGGSSFISGYAGVNAITGESSTVATNNTLHYSGKYFVLGSMYQGTNSGNGMASIYYEYLDKPAKSNTNLNGVRYIKDCATGNSSGDNFVSWREIQAIVNGQNVAYGKTVTGTVAYHTSRSPYSTITDGLIIQNVWATTSTADTTSRCVTVDLGQSYNLDEVVIWHAYDTAYAVTYNNNVISVSANNSTWTTIAATTEPETNFGKRISAWD